MSSRLLGPDLIPRSMWDGTRDTLVLPLALATTYQKLIDAHCLAELAAESSPKDGPTGGVSDSDTRKHFAQRFAASSGRVQLAVLDPRDELSCSSDLIVRAFSGGQVAMLDAPCGTGAAFGSLLATIASLRSEGRLPMDPLDVKIVVGDISPLALQIAREVHNHLRPDLERVAIESSITPVTWDAKGAASTVDLIRPWVAAERSGPTKFMIVANFSDYLGTNFKHCRDQLSDLFRWADTYDSTVAWVEPHTDKATTVFGLLGDLIKEIRLRVLRRDGEERPSPIAKSQVVLQSPLDATKTFPVRVGLMLLKGVGVRA